ncbi:putative repeat protein (TIGR01451 family) [Streptomyces sp. 840.1]|nr:putative repeat protein (TIGR01451 family) [Streptomyces sp. 840.1]
MAAAGLGLPGQPAAAQPVGVPLVDETFTGAGAQAGFEAFGPACLTGAPQSPATGPGTHPLAGCPAGATGPVPPDNAAPKGYLRLTDASNDQSAAVLYNHALPANQGLVTSFDQWQYGGTTSPPADGISFFLIDGAASLTSPGAFGGSLGYAQKLPDDDPGRTFLPGVDRGYLGVGLDVLGNYFGDWEHRGNGCATRSPAGTSFRVPAPGQNMVTLRGPGDGTEGYCFLDATTSNHSTTGPWPSTLPGQLHGPTVSIPPGSTPEEAEALLEPSRRTVTVEISPAPDPVIMVAVDFHDGNGSRQVLSAPAPQPVPDTYKFGFAASTGLFTDVHLLRNLTVHPAAALPQLNLVKQVSQEPPLALPLTPGARVPYEYVATNSGNVPLTDVNVTDDRVTDISCPRTTLGVGETMTCTGTYTVTDADGTAGSVTNTATAQGKDGGTPVVSPPDDVTLPVRSGPGLRLEKSADDTREYRAGDEVTYTYTVTNTGPEQLTGIAVTDDRVSAVTCGTTTLAPAGQEGDSTTCTGTYTVTDEDAAQGSVTNTATARGRAGEAEVTSPPDNVTLPVKGEEPCHGKGCHRPPPCHDGKGCHRPPPCHDGRGCHRPPPCHEGKGCHRPTPTPTHSPSPAPHPGPGHDGPQHGGGHLADTGAGTTLLAGGAGLAGAGLLLKAGLVMRSRRTRNRV